MKRVFAIAVVAYLVVLAIVLHASIKDFLWTHPWWHSTLAALPTIALAVFACLDWHDSGEANRLRNEANVLRKRIADLEAERNQHLQQIAKNTEKPVTQAERNAEALRKHLRANVLVSEGQGSWSNTPEIVAVSDDSIVTLFTPRGSSSSSAWCVNVHCGELEISDIPQGSCPLRLKVIKRYGPDVQLGEITKWEDRLQHAGAPTFAKGDTAYHATYQKPGSPETRSLYVHASSDGANSFMLEASTGERVIGNNEEISKRFMLLQIEYQVAGFTRTGSGSGNTLYRLFIC